VGPPGGGANHRLDRHEDNGEYGRQRETGDDEREADPDPWLSREPPVAGHERGPADGDGADQERDQTGSETDTRDRAKR